MTVCIIRRRTIYIGITYLNVKIISSDKKTKKRQVAYFASINV